jgi:hypothetical protein
MSRYNERSIIESVEFEYVGTTEQFNTFLKNIIKDYISENNMFPDINECINSDVKKTA